MAIKFDPKTMKHDGRDPKIIYDSKRRIGNSVALTSGYVIIGVKGNPSASTIRETIRHEKSHLPEKVRSSYQRTGYLQRAERELSAYSREKRLCTASQWNRILPVRIKDFMPSISWLNKGEQGKIKGQVSRVLSPKAGGGNLDAITKARRRLANFWL